MRPNSEIMSARGIARRTAEGQAIVPDALAIFIGRGPCQATLADPVPGVRQADRLPGAVIERGGCRAGNVIAVVETPVGGQVLRLARRALDRFCKRIAGDCKRAASAGRSQNAKCNSGAQSWLTHPGLLVRPVIGSVAHVLPCQTGASASIRTGTDFDAGVLDSSSWCASDTSTLHSG